MDIAIDSQVRAALQARKGEWARIAERSGVSHSWLSKFVNGHIANPGFGTLKRLHGELITNAPAAPATQEAGDAA